MEWSSRRVLLLCGVLMLVSAAVTVFVMSHRSNDIVLRFEPIVDATTASVYVGGAVQHPGLYTLPSGSRLSEAIDKAGALDDADLSGLRMADPIQDKMTIFVPHRLAASAAPTPDQQSANATPRATTISTSSSPGVQTVSPVPHLININTASLEELESLPGIGPALAQRIIDYRIANGPFASPEDLDEVKGISARMVDSFRTRISTGGGQ